MEGIEKVWPEWRVEKEIGRGSFAAVYRCVKEENGAKEYCAVKVISVPQDGYGTDEVRTENMSEEETKIYYKEIADDLVKEIEILRALKGTENIVEIYDAKVVEKEKAVGWTIYIRMELLTDLNTYMCDKKLSEDEIIKLGTDLSRGLAVCHKAKIIHRDIKPENIFVDDRGNFKLGDFGVARQLEKTQCSVSVKGTYNYMSPEVYAGKKCDGKSDMYSLALVMYKLLNHNRLPFLDPNKQIVRFSERQAAFKRRIKGEKLPPIAGISDELNAVILQACAFKSADRQKNIEEFAKELELIGKGKKKIRLSRGRIVAVVAVSLVFLFAAVFGVLFAANETVRTGVEKLFAQENETTSPVETAPERKYNTVLNAHSVFEDGSIVCDGCFFVEPGKVIHTDDATVTDLSEVLKIDQPDNSRYMCDSKYIYYSVDREKSVQYNVGIGFDIYRYDITTKESKIIYSSENEALERIVYCDDENIYFTQWDRTYIEGFEIGPANLKKYNFSSDRLTTISLNIYEVFVYNGYIVFTTVYGDLDLTAPLSLYVYDTVENSLIKIAKSCLTLDISYWRAGELYFIEVLSQNNIESDIDSCLGEVCISKYNMKTGKKESVSHSKEVEIADTYEMEEGMINDQYAVIPNTISVWIYKSDKSYSLKPLNSQEEASWYCNDLFVEKSISDKILYLDSDGYKKTLYEILGDGSFHQLGNEIYTTELNIVIGLNAFMADGKLYVISEEDASVSVHDFFADSPAQNIEFAEKKEKVYTTQNVNVRVGPDKSYDSLGIIKAGTTVDRIATGSNDWSKVLYEGEVAYISSKYLTPIVIEKSDYEILKQTLVLALDNSSINGLGSELFGNYIHEFLISGMYELYDEYFGWNSNYCTFVDNKYDEKKGEYITGDPLKKFEDVKGYAYFPESKVVWIFENIFNTDISEFSSSDYYQYQGKFYCSYYDYDYGSSGITINNCQNDGTLYTFDLNTYQKYCTSIMNKHFRLTAEPESHNGKKYWSIQNFQRLFSDEEIVFERYCKKEYNDDMNHEYIFCDLDQDGTREMLVKHSAYGEGHDDYELLYYDGTLVKSAGKFQASGDFEQLYYLKSIHAVCYADLTAYEENPGNLNVKLLSMNDHKLVESDFVFNGDISDLELLELTNVVYMPEYE
ncbi:MAG: protein kinase [Acutalibacteraceae bacterium]